MKKCLVVNTLKDSFLKNARTITREELTESELDEKHFDLHRYEGVPKEITLGVGDSIVVLGPTYGSDVQCFAVYTVIN